MRLSLLHLILWVELEVEYFFGKRFYFHNRAGSAIHFLYTFINKRIKCCANQFVCIVWVPQRTGLKTNRLHLLKIENDERSYYASTGLTLIWLWMSDTKSDRLISTMGEIAIDYAKLFTRSTRSYIYTFIGSSRALKQEFQLEPELLGWSSCIVSKLGFGYNLSSKCT